VTKGGGGAVMVSEGMRDLDSRGGRTREFSNLVRKTGFRLELVEYYLYSSTAFPCSHYLEAAKSSDCFPRPTTSSLNFTPLDLILLLNVPDDSYKV